MIELTKTGGKNHGTMYWVTTACVSHKLIEIGRGETLQHVLIEGDLAIGTDGKRMHIGRLDPPIEPGTYRIIKRTKSVIILELAKDHIIYPDWEGVVPTKKPTTQIELRTGNDCTADINYAETIRAMPSNTVRFQYFQDLGGLGGTIDIIDENNPITYILPGNGKDYKRKGLIMPIKT